MSTTAPILTEQSSDGFVTYTTRWMTEPPPPGVGFCVLRESWNEDMTVRTIYEIDAQPKQRKESHDI